MNFLPNLRTEIRQKNLFRKKNNLRIFKIPKCPKINFGPIIHSNKTDYFLYKINAGNEI